MDEWRLEVPEEGVADYTWKHEAEVAGSNWMGAQEWLRATWEDGSPATELSFLNSLDHVHHLHELRRADSLGLRAPHPPMMVPRLLAHAIDRLPAPYSGPEPP